MPLVEVTLPKSIDAEIDRLVDEEEFLNRDQAMESLLQEGLSTYTVSDDTPLEMAEDVFTGTFDDQEDPATVNDQGPSRFR